MGDSPSRTPSDQRQTVPGAGYMQSAVEPRDFSVPQKASAGGSLWVPAELGVSELPGTLRSMTGHSLLLLPAGGAGDPT